MGICRREQEAWLKEYMIYAGRADMHSDWLQFQSDCKRKRENDERTRIRHRAANIALFWSALLWGTGVLVVVPLGMYIAFQFLILSTDLSKLATRPGRLNI